MSDKDARRFCTLMNALADSIENASDHDADQDIKEGSEDISADRTRAVLLAGLTKYRLRHTKALPKRGVHE